MLPPFDTQPQQILVWRIRQLKYPEPLLGTSTDSESLDGSSTKKATREADIEAQCLDYAAVFYPDALSIRPIELQGGCSFTINIQHGLDGPSTASCNDTMLQFRRARFKLDVDYLQRVREVHGPLVPETRYLGHHTYWVGSREVYEMSVVPGVRFDSVQPRNQDLEDHDVGRIKGLLDDMAAYFATSFLDGSTPSIDSQARLNGRIGATLVQRLSKLSTDLPTHELQSIAERALDAVQRGDLDCLPVVLTHGDLLPTNIFVDPQTWTLTGLVDWAEAEDLPFGIGLYGVEHLLGFVDVDEHWVWYDRAVTLREHFYACLERRLPTSMAEDRAFRNEVKLARDVGVLLWHGYAWDDGSLDRVVSLRDDPMEVAMLDAFLMV